MDIDVHTNSTRMTICKRSHKNSADKLFKTDFTKDFSVSVHSILNFGPFVDDFPRCSIFLSMAVTAWQYERKYCRKQVSIGYCPVHPCSRGWNLDEGVSSRMVETIQLGTTERDRLETQSPCSPKITY